MSALPCGAVEFLDVPSCCCPTHERCPDCGAGCDTRGRPLPCIESCRCCEAEWPPGVPCCPGCGVLRTAAHRKTINGRSILISRNPASCPRADQERARLPSCVHVQQAPGADLDEDADDVQRGAFESGGASYVGRRLPRRPTEESPGTEAKLAVMAERNQQKEALFHPRDEPIDLRCVVNAENRADRARGNNSDPLEALDRVAEQDWRRQADEEDQRHEEELVMREADAVARERLRRLAGSLGRPDPFRMTAEEVRARTLARRWTAEDEAAAFGVEEDEADLGRAC